MVVLCRHGNGSLFLLCSCFFFQRMLIICRHILAVKNGNLVVDADVFFRWHLLYATSNLDRKLFQRSAQDGKMNGPGVDGIATAELRAAIADLAPGRDGVQSWLSEGGMSWVPDSTAVWGQVSLESWQQEAENAVCSES